MGCLGMIFENLPPHEQVVVLEVLSPKSYYHPQNQQSHNLQYHEDIKLLVFSELHVQCMYMYW